MLNKDNLIDFNPKIKGFSAFLLVIQQVIKKYGSNVFNDLFKEEAKARILRTSSDALKFSDYGNKIKTDIINVFNEATNKKYAINDVAKSKELTKKGSEISKYFTDNSDTISDKLINVFTNNINEINKLKGPALGHSLLITNSIKITYYNPDIKEEFKWCI